MLVGLAVLLVKDGLHLQVRKLGPPVPAAPPPSGSRRGSSNTSSAPPLVFMPTPTGLFPLSENALLYLSDAQAQACEVSVPGGNTNKPV